MNTTWHVPAASGGRRILAPLLAVWSAACSSGACSAAVSSRAAVEPGVSVGVVPATVSLAPLRTAAFTATVTGTLDKRVTWSVEGTGSGTIDASGLYTAPAAQGAYRILATSVADPKQSGQALAEVTPDSSIDPSAIVPSIRTTAWVPGLMAVGGIPNRTTQCGAVVQASAYGDGTRDATAAIQAAIDACPVGQVVQLSAGTFLLNSNFLLIGKGITLRGMGASATTLNITNGMDVYNGGAGFVQKPHIIIGPTRWPNFGTSRNLTADAVKGTYSVTVASTSGLAVGEIVLIDELQDSNLIYYDPGDLPGGYSWFMRNGRPLQEFKEISAISGSTVTFNTPLHMAYRTAFTAQLTPMAAGSKHIKYAGVEDLGTRGGGEGNIRLTAAAYSWVKGVECTWWQGECVDIEMSFRTELRDSFLHDGGVPFPGGGGYAISVQQGTSDTLVENNIVLTTVAPGGSQVPSGPNVKGINKVMVFRAAGAGSVVGYNYVDNGIVGYDFNWQEVGINASHMCGSHHVLLEGNHAFNADGDNTHGNQVYHTFYRNYLTGKRSLYDTAFHHRGFGMMAGNWWMTAVGNVIGYPGMAGQETTIVYETTTASGFQSDSIWKLGYNPADWNANGDPKVISTLLRHGNFDYLTSAVAWDPGIASQALPSSLYLTRKPAFFSAGKGYAWPWVDPTAALPVATLPAKARWDAGTPFVQP